MTLLPEERIAELAVSILRGGLDKHEAFALIRTAIRESGEEAAKVAESYVWFEDRGAAPDDGNVRIAAAIRERLR